MCRKVLRHPCYDERTSADLIRWLGDSDEALSDLAGRALAVLGLPAFNDLIAFVTSSEAAPWPNAVWALTLCPEGHDRLLPLLRSWLARADGELERQCATSLGQILVARKRQGYAPDPDDVEICRRVLEREAATHLGIRVHLREFRKGLGMK